MQHSFDPHAGITAIVGPANADIAFFRRLPAVATAAHPVVSITQRHHADPVIGRQLGSTVHHLLRRQVADGTLRIPLFDGA